MFFAVEEKWSVCHSNKIKAEGTLQSLDYLGFSLVICQWHGCLTKRIKLNFALAQRSYNILLVYPTHSASKESVIIWMKRRQVDAILLPLPLPLLLFITDPQGHADILDIFTSKQVNRSGTCCRYFLG